ncbi:hypothetical protein PG911_03970 [Tenacibaculum ovolyticum]|uniref:hypothetical protein n=1 Tax=Tenacibaculum ovolyticum TaxID=104270 RepID=UPI0022F3D108|nr:hypothetical protein [Tenacibaculum ovolyticum]WBX77430.1 hypothetical protein PG911_03970 [Tenacibaculum ovolyticum]
MNFLKSEYFEIHKLTKPDLYNNQYLDGKFKFIKLSLTLDIEFQISNEDRNTKISLATFEELFYKFYQKFDNTFLDKLINQTINSLSNDIGKYKRKNEIDRLRNRVKLSDIVFSFERYLDFHTDDDIPPYSERNEIIMRFLDKDFLNSHEIVVEIESNDDFAFKEAYFEHI